LVENNHQGKAFAVITGIRQSESDYVLFSDMDLATPIEEAEKLLDVLDDDHQIVIGSRSRDRKDAPLSRKVLALGYIFIRDLLVGLQGIKDTQCGFKLFNRNIALEIIDKLKVFHDNRTANGPSVTAGFDLEFLFLSSQRGHKIKEVPVVWRHVETKRVNFIHDAVETLKDILRIKLYSLQGKYDV
jgi:dolichyl-phosphate beta-glucosyltransferase